VGTYYDRLTKVAELDYATDATEKAQYEKLLQSIEDCRSLAKEYCTDPGLSGETATAALSWLADYDTRLVARADALKAASLAHDDARAVMLQAKADHNKLSPRLLTPVEQSAVNVTEAVFTLAGLSVVGKVWVEALTGEREDDREAASLDALTKMNESILPTGDYDPTGLPDLSIKVPSSTTTSMPTSGSGGRKSSRSYLVGGGGAGVSSPPSLVGTPIVTADPANPLNGYVPPPVTDAEDERWRQGYTYTPGLGAGTGAIIGGVMGLGATALAARSLASSLSAGSLSAGSVAALNGQLANGGRAPGGGMLSNNSAAAAGSQSAGGKSANSKAANRGGLTGGSNSAGGKDKRKRGVLRGYVAEQVDEDHIVEPGPGVEPGSVSTLAPLPVPDAGERW
jgi:hypothetical protein